MYRMLMHFEDIFNGLEIKMNIKIAWIQKAWKKSWVINNFKFVLDEEKQNGYDREMVVWQRWSLFHYKLN